MNQLGNLIDLYPTLNTSNIHQCGATNSGITPNPNMLQIFTTKEIT